MGGMSVLKESSTLALALGAGFATLGIGGILLHCRLRNKVNTELNYLQTSVIQLQARVTELQKSLDGLSERCTASINSQTAAKKSKGWYSVPASSGDEDDLYEEALGGGEDTFHEPEQDGEGDFGARDESPLTDELYGTVDRLLDGSDSEKEEAYNLLNDKSNMLSGDPDHLWRSAKATYFLSQIFGARTETDRKKELVYKAKDLACAITLGSWAEYEGMQQRIKCGYTFKEHITKAIELNPQDPSSHYLLGRWCFGVYMLTWIERNVAATLFATPPISTVDEALKCFLEAENLNPGKWKENMLFIAKCYIEKSDYQNAKEWLAQAKDIETTSQDDKEAHKEIETLMQKY